MNLMILMRQNDLRGRKTSCMGLFFLFSSSFFFVLFRDARSPISHILNNFFLCSPLDEEGLAALKTSNIYSLVMTHEDLPT